MSLIGKDYLDKRYTTQKTPRINSYRKPRDKDTDEFLKEINRELFPSKEVRLGDSLTTKRLILSLGIAATMFAFLYYGIPLYLAIFS